jgi:hypothetical protein
MTPIPVPSSSLGDLERLTRTELSRAARLGHVLLALAASALTIVVVSLWLTEPALPLRTQVAFALLSVIGVGWITYSLWVLRTRRVMLARHRMVAGRLAVAFSGVFTAGCLALLVSGQSAAARPALLMSLAWLAGAIVIWRRASTAHAKLLDRRAELERQMDRGAK